MADLVEVFLSIVALIIVTSPVIAFEDYRGYFPPSSRISIKPDTWAFSPEFYAGRSANPIAMGAGSPLFAPEPKLFASPANPEPQLIAQPTASVSEAQAHVNNFNATRAILDLLRSWVLQDERAEPDASRAAAKVPDYVYSTNAFGYAGAPHDYWTPHVDYSYAPAPHSYPPMHYYEHPTIELYKPVLPKPVIPKPVLPALPSKPLIQNLVNTKPTAVSTNSKLPMLQALLQLVLTFLGLPTGSGATTATSNGASGLLGTLSNLSTALFSSKPAIKAVIGKLAIPVVVLVLANVEILTLIWWLWEDCPAPAPAPVPVPVPAPAPVPAHHSYDYNYYGPDTYQPQSSFHY